MKCRRLFLLPLLLRAAGCEAPGPSVPSSGSAPAVGSAAPTDAKPLTTEKGKSVNAGEPGGPPEKPVY